MTNITIGIQVILDSFLFFICSMGIFEERERWSIKDTILLSIMILYCLIARVSVDVRFDMTAMSFEREGYELLPVNSISLLIFLFLTMLITNSTWFKTSNMYAFFGTLAVFAIYMMLRIGSVMLVGILRVSSGQIMAYGNRIVSIGLAGIIYYMTGFKRIKESLKEGSLAMRLITTNTVLLLGSLLIFFEFDILKFTLNLPLLISIFIGFTGINYIILLIEERNTEKRKRITLLEQYLSVIEELIYEVRGRQHEFNNQLLAISAAITISENLEEAEEKVNKLIQGIQLNPAHQTILSCDSKVIGGMVYSKMKQAEMKRLEVEVEMEASFKKSKVQEYHWIELIGILMDNAIEASTSGDVIYFRYYQEEGERYLLVSNPYEPISNTQFIQMFRRGYTSKKNITYESGHGLTNVREIVDYYHGKIMTRNEIIQDRNYVTIGVILA